MLVIPREECGICFKGRNPKQESGFTKINFPITPQRSRSVQMLIRNKVVFFFFSLFVTAEEQDITKVAWDSDLTLTAG